MASEAKNPDNTVASTDVTNPNDGWANGGVACATGTASGSTATYNFTGAPFNLPAGAIITGIQVDIKWGLNDNNDSLTVEVQDSGAAWRSKAIANKQVANCAATTNSQLGLDGDLWGGTFTEAHVESANFQVRWTNVASAKAADTYVDSVLVTVYYATVTDASEDLFAKFKVVKSASEDLFAKFIIRQEASEDLFAAFLVAGNGMEQVLFGGYNDLLDPVATEYNSLIGGYLWNAEESWRAKIVSTDGVLKQLRVKLSGAPDTDNKYTFTLMLNGNPTALTLDISDLETTGNDMVQKIEVAGGNRVSLRCVPDGNPVEVYATWTLVFESYGAKESLVMGGSGFALSIDDIEYAQIMGGSNYGVTENNYRVVVPTSGTLKHLYVWIQVDPGESPEAYRFTVRLNGATVGESLIVTITADDTTGYDLIHNLVIVADDILTFMVEPLNSPTVAPPAVWGMTFVAAVDGESIVLGATSNNLPDIDTEYNSILPGHDLLAWNPDETLFYQLGQVCTLKKLHVLLSVAPGADNDYDFAIRIAGTNVVTLQISDGDTTGDSGALEDAVAVDEYLSLRVIPTGTPAVADAYWGFVGYIDPSFSSGSEDLFADMVIRNEDYAELFSDFTVRQTGTEDLFAKFIVVKSGSEDLFADLIIRNANTEDLFAKFTVRQTGTEDLFAKFIPIRSASEDLFADLIIRQEAYQELYAKFQLLEVGSEDLFAKFIVRQTGTADLFADLIVRQEGSEELFADLTIRNVGTRDLFSEFEVRQTGTQDLFSDLIIRNAGTRDLYAKFEIQGSEDLFAKFTVRRTATADLFAKFLIGQEDSEDLFAKFIVRQEASQDLFAKFEVSAIIDDQVDLFAKFTVRQEASEDLFADLTVRQEASEELFADLTVRQEGYQDLKATFILPEAEDLFAKFEVRQEASQDLFSKFQILETGSENLFSKFIIRQTGTGDLFADLIIRNADYADLKAELIVRTETTKDLFAKFVVAQTGFQNLFAKFETYPAVDLFATFTVRKSWRKVLYCKLVVRHSATLDLFSDFKVSQGTITQDLFCQFFVDQYNAFIELPGYFYVRPDRLSAATFDIKAPTPRRMGVKKPARRSSRWLR